MKIKKIIFVCLFSLYQQHAISDVIFDIGRVLIDTDTFASARHIGVNTIIQCMIALKIAPQNINTHLKNQLFEVLHHTPINEKITHTNYVYDEQGIALPPIMCAWLSGTMKCKEIRTCAINTVKKNPLFFKHKAEEQAIINLITMIFTPTSFIATRKAYKESIPFIKACKKRGHRIYGLSNWDPESFDLLKKKYPDIFDLFDGIVISGESKSTKPSSDIYETLIKQYNLNPQCCWFIDDQKENVATAKALGINGIVCQYTWLRKPDFHKIARLIKTNSRLS